MSEHTPGPWCETPYEDNPKSQPAGLTREMPGEWVVLTYQDRLIEGLPPGINRYVFTTESIFGPFKTRDEACDWAVGHPRLASWTVKCLNSPTSTLN